jgi:hypothetical protein
MRIRAADVWAMALGAAVVAFPVDLSAQGPPPAGPVAVASDSPDVAVNIGLAPGIKIPVTRRWLFDIEFVGHERPQSTRGPPNFVWYSGVVHDCGPFSVGVRVAVAVDAGRANNVSLVSTVSKRLRMYDNLRWFVELGLPVSLDDMHDNRIVLAPLLQTRWNL